MGLLTYAMLPTTVLGTTIITIITIIPNNYYPPKQATPNPESSLRSKDPVTERNHRRLISGEGNRAWNNNNNNSTILLTANYTTECSIQLT